MQLIYGYCCEQGVKRDKNQDRMFFRQGYAGGRQICISAVCDGVGAFANSEFASQYVVDRFNDWFGRLCDDHPPDKGFTKRKISIVYEEIKNSLREMLWAAHKRVADETAERNFSAGTTVCAILAVDSLYCIYNTGDSRAYEVGRTLRQLTQDQTTEHDGKKTLSNCLGCFPGPNFSRVEGKIRKGTAFIISSDGFYRRWDEMTAVKLLKKSKDSDELFNAMRGLRDISLGRGENDDSTGIAIKFI